MEGFRKFADSSAIGFASVKPFLMPHSRWFDQPKLEFGAKIELRQIGRGAMLAAEIRKFAIKRSQEWANDQPNSRGGVAACTFDSNGHPTPIGMLRHVDDYERSTDLFRRAGDLVDKILRGSKPSNIPVEQPIAFEIVINLTKRRLSGLRSLSSSYCAPTK